MKMTADLHKRQSWAIELCLIVAIVKFVLMVGAFVYGAIQPNNWCMNMSAGLGIGSAFWLFVALFLTGDSIFPFFEKLLRRKH